MDSPDLSTVASSSHHKSMPCRWYSHGGNCRFGDRCRFGHNGDVLPAGTEGKDLDSSHCANGTDSVLKHSTCDPRPRHKRGNITCRARKVGNCAKGSDYWFRHDAETFLATSSDEQKATASSGFPNRSANLVRDTKRARVSKTTEATGCARAHAIAQEEAAYTVTQLVSGSIVTFGAGLDVVNLITGFETCTVRVANIPRDVTEHDIYALLKEKGLDLDRAAVDVKKKRNDRCKASIVTDIASGRELASALEGLEFHDEPLVIETTVTNAIEGMSAKSGESSDILTISWRASSVRYVAEYFDIDSARAMVKVLNRFVYCGRRIKVDMNTQPRGRFVPNLSLNAIRIDNLPISVTDKDIIGLTGALAVKRLSIRNALGITNADEEIARLVRYEIEWAISNGLRKFETPGPCTLDGVVSVRAHFASWDEAHVAHEHLSDKRFYNQLVWLRLPNPMHFTLVIPAEQYKAQKPQWESLVSSIKDRKACTLSVREAGNVVLIRLSGSVKEATGALKVRVENLTRGEKVEGWHPSLGNRFMLRVNSETGAYLRNDVKNKLLKVYGSTRVIDEARAMIREELERLVSLDYTIVLPWRSVGFFVREGLQQLKETLGENNVRFMMSSRRITVSGGEESRHALDDMVTFALSYKGKDGPSKVSQDEQTCPVCYDSVASPHRLGCGHVYCVTCLRHLVSSAVDTPDQLPLVCIGDDAQCRRPIPIPVIQLFIPPALFNRLLTAAFDAYITKHAKEFKHCKTPDCVQIYRAALAGMEPQTLHCPSCFSRVCDGCHEDAHEGLSCAGRKAQDPAEQERLNEAWITEQGGRVKKCPQCGVPIEKLEGCNHMECRCGAHICWRCMGIFGPDVIYNHMRDVHGSIHDDDAPAVGRFPPILEGLWNAIDDNGQRELLQQADRRRARGMENLDRNVPLVHDPYFGMPDPIRWQWTMDWVQRGLEEEEEGLDVPDPVFVPRQVVREQERPLRVRLAGARERDRQVLAERRQGRVWECTVM